MFLRGKIGAWFRCLKRLKAKLLTNKTEYSAAGSKSKHEAFKVYEVKLFGTLMGLCIIFSIEVDVHY